jgi:enamine deaminase RidA (YjgF/YER057c/UK114 family)
MSMYLNFRMHGVLLGAALLCTGVSQVSVAAGAAAADESVMRLALPAGNDFPISSAVKVSAGVDTYYLSGALPSVSNKDAPKGSVESYGDMETQATSALESLKSTLERLGLTMGDVVKMQVFMVANPDGKLDFAGLMAGYKKFFATADQPNKPARSAFQVAALVAPGALVEIEVIAAKAHPKAAAKAANPHK